MASIKDVEEKANVGKATVSRVLNNSGYVLSFGDSKVTVNREELAPYEGKEVILGIRPEDIHAEEAMKDAHPESVMKVDVTLAEMMGSEIYVYTEYAGTKVISRVPAKYDIKTDDKVTLVPDVNKIHIFDPETEEVICQ